ncbi:unnamed protein product [Natator depressus]
MTHLDRIDVSAPLLSVQTHQPLPLSPLPLSFRITKESEIHSIITDLQTLSSSVSNSHSLCFRRRLSPGKGCTLRLPCSPCFGELAQLSLKHVSIAPELAGCRAVRYIRPHPQGLSTPVPGRIGQEARRGLQRS